jgi:penicillin-insensitive murein endopeptidase
MRLEFAFGALLLFAVHGAEAADWASVGMPTSGAVRSVGGPAGGCVAGAVPLPLDGPGYQVVRISRNRMWGHPGTIAFVQALGAQALAMGLPPLYVGDISQPRGGPMRDGHASHQNGNDVDVWFNIDPKPDLPPAAREEIPIVRLVTADEQSIDATAWRPAHARLLHAAASNPAVDRVFVHFAIKRELCRSEAGDRSWLRKIRPWFGHDDHFHVRLACPAGSGECVAQAPIPPGDGCDATLDWWFADAIERHKSVRHPPPRPRAPPKLPQACVAILNAR